MSLQSTKPTLNDTQHSTSSETLSLREFRNQYVTRVLTLVDMDVDEAISTLGVSETDVRICFERV
ncbi:MAG TPA: hypothetical protein PK869_11805 [Candidatus Hydrogenedentes bacterium]|nr:hypothetical protein [Candidatus Hydrogenedentota bacterium]